MPVEDLQAGHFIPRRYVATRWHPLNVWPQCSRCNVELSGNLKLYEGKLVSQFSDLAVDALWDIARAGQITDQEIADVIVKYK